MNWPRGKNIWLSHVSFIKDSVNNLLFGLFMIYRKQSQHAIEILFNNKLSTNFHPSKTSLHWKKQFVWKISVKVNYLILSWEPSVKWLFDQYTYNDYLLFYSLYIYTDCRIKSSTYNQFSTDRWSKNPCTFDQCLVYHYFLYVDVIRS